jgi:hypothetical protein
MRNPLAPFLLWLSRKRAERDIAAAERRRAAIAAQIAHRRATKAEWRPMLSDMRQATNASLAASCGRDWVR